MGPLSYGTWRTKSKWVVWHAPSILASSQEALSSSFFFGKLCGISGKRSATPWFTPAVTQGIRAFGKAHPQEAMFVSTLVHSLVVQARRSDKFTDPMSSGGCAHSDPAQFPVGCDVLCTPVSNALGHPMCATILAGFRRCQFHDGLRTVLDEYVQAHASLAKLAIPKAAMALVKQKGWISRTSCIV